ncbi:MAG: NAD+ kinase [Gammaproteobacteria bacterium]|nr:MAG: NAD+ kinase [Gammaproteobacteria bacterium]TND04766.1 MAG: NAD+ kinase [Gammaproteobacteria bacterium]
MKPAFKTIALIGKHDDPRIGPTLQTLAAFLKQQQVDIILDENTARILPGHGLEAGDRQLIGRRCDLAIVVGGDGTLLNVARTLADFGVPVVGIHLGRLGFLADITPDVMIQNIGEILGGHYIEEERFLLHAIIQRDGATVGDSDAFNDVVVHKWNVARMIELETYIDDNFVSNERSDGLIVATPTGSTAYALSGGGPILHPTLDAILLVPISPHTLSHRPIVVAGSSKIEIVCSESNREKIQATCDGQISFGLEPGDRVVIRKKERTVRLVHPVYHDHYEILRAKLHWSENP